MDTKERLSRLNGTTRAWMTDAGFETSLLFHDGFDLPGFCAMVLMDNADARVAMTKWFERFISLARDAGTGFVLDTNTWRGAPVWGELLGKSEAEMLRLNRDAIRFARDLRDRHETPDLPIILNAVHGPTGDGYSPEMMLTPDAARALHLPQATIFAEEGADMISALTMTHTGEGIGVARAAAAVGLRSVISYTVETDGRLPSGQTLRDAIAETDAAAGDNVLYYMVNCAHPTHFADELGGAWTARIGGVRANASRRSHAELDAATELDDGNPEEFGELYAALAVALPRLRVFGGCCGSDDRHVGCAARHVLHDAVAA